MNYGEHAFEHKEYIDDLTCVGRMAYDDGGTEDPITSFDGRGILLLLKNKADAIAFRKATGVNPDHYDSFFDLLATVQKRYSLALPVGCHKHGYIFYYVATKKTKELSNYFDSNNNAGIWMPDQPYQDSHNNSLKNIPETELQNKHIERVDSILSDYSDWVNGSVFTIETFWIDKNGNETEPDICSDNCIGYNTTKNILINNVHSQVHIKAKEYGLISETEGERKKRIQDEQKKHLQQMQLDAGLVILSF